jgi:protein SCO1
MTRAKVIALGIGMLTACVGGPVLAQGQGISRANPSPSVASREQDRILKTVRLEQKLNGQIPMDAQFRDEAGKTVRLQEYFGEKPVMLMLLQYRCTMLCQEQVRMLQESLSKLSFTPGKQFNLLLVSIDPRENAELAAEVKAKQLEQYKRPEAAAGWHFLTGDKQNIDRLAEAVGFHYVYDARTDQYAHPDGLITATPEGKVARYHFRLEYRPQDMKFGLMEAAKHRIGSPMDVFALLCYHYNPADGTYGLSLLKLMRVAAGATLLGLCFGIAAMKLRERAGARAVKAEG